MAEHTFLFMGAGEVKFLKPRIKLLKLDFKILGLPWNRHTFGQCDE
jgi:hypothetical protein